MTEHPSQTPIDRYLLGEHRRFDQLMADVEFLVDRRSFLQAAKRFGELRAALESHLHAEERVLLPLFENGDPRRKGAAKTLRDEHRKMLAMLDHLGAAISRNDFALFAKAVREFDVLAIEHQDSEQRVLHPWLEKVVHTEADYRRLCQESHVELL